MNAASIAGWRGLPEALHTRRTLWLTTAVAAVLLTGVGVDLLLQPGAFPVQRVSLEGEFKHVQPEVLRAAVLKAVDGNFFALDLKRIERAARAVPWVGQVSVRREWPQSLHIRYAEHQVVARWGERWISSTAVVVDLPGSDAPRGLPELDGPAGLESTVLERYDALSTVFSAGGLVLRGLRLSERRSWEARVADPRVPGREFTLVLGRREVAGRANRFVSIYPAAFGATAGAIDRVDLRYPNGFSVAWASDVRAAGASTNTEVRK